MELYPLMPKINSSIILPVFQHALIFKMMMIGTKLNFRKSELLWLGDFFFSKPSDTEVFYP